MENKGFDFLGRYREIIAGKNCPKKTTTSLKFGSHRFTAGIDRANGIYLIHSHDLLIEYNRMKFDSQPDSYLAGQITAHQNFEQALRDAQTQYTQDLATLIKAESDFQDLNGDWPEDKQVCDRHSIFYDPFYCQQELGSGEMAEYILRQGINVLDLSNPSSFPKTLAPDMEKLSKIVSQLLSSNSQLIETLKKRMETYEEIAKYIV